MSSNSKFTFASDRLQFRPIQSSDLLFFAKLYKSKKVSRYVWGSQLSIEETELVLEGLLNFWKKRNYGFWMVHDLEGQAIGYAGFQDNWHYDDIEYGCVLSEEAMGKGYGTEITKVFAEYAKNVLGVTQICGVADVRNIDSIKMIKKVGFEEVEKLQKAKMNYLGFMLKL